MVMRKKPTRIRLGKGITGKEIILTRKGTAKQLKSAKSRGRIAVVDILRAGTARAKQRAKLREV